MDWHELQMLMLPLDNEYIPPLHILSDAIMPDQIFLIDAGSVYGG